MHTAIKRAIPKALSIMHFRLKMLFLQLFLSNTKRKASLKCLYEVRVIFLLMNLLKSTSTGAVIKMLPAEEVNCLWKRQFPNLFVFCKIIKHNLLMQSKPFIYLLFLLILVAACKSPEARRPVDVKSGSSVNASVERNKELYAAEE